MSLVFISCVKVMAYLLWREFCLGFVAYRPFALIRNTSDNYRPILLKNINDSNHLKLPMFKLSKILVVLTNSSLLKNNINKRKIKQNHLSKQENISSLLIQENGF